jgi:hypothetical protein
VSHIETAKAAINDRLAAAYRHRGDPVMHHSELKEALATVVRIVADPRLQPYSLRVLHDLAKKTLDAVEKVQNDEPARLD